MTLGTVCGLFLAAGSLNAESFCREVVAVSADVENLWQGRPPRSARPRGAVHWAVAGPALAERAQC